METVIDRIAVETQQQAAAVKRSGPARSNQLRLVAENKRDLDQMLQIEQGNGWTLVSRSYSMDDGHGATLVWKERDKAA